MATFTKSMQHFAEDLTKTLVGTVDLPICFVIFGVLV